MPNEPTERHSGVHVSSLCSGVQTPAPTKPSRDSGRVGLRLAPVNRERGAGVSLWFLTTLQAVLWD